jgi:threonine dehydrogenase-like Zn-dependent dehydrogenase
MRGLWLERKQLRFREDLAAPGAAPGEALIRVALAGICGTDLELARGYYPFAGVPGHEFVGIVEEAPGAPEWVGRRVVGEINAACGHCLDCAAGRRSHCPERTVLGIRGRNGALAERCALPIVNLHEVPSEVPDEVAVFAEPVAAALEVQEQVPIGPGQRVAVIGDGRLGQLLARTLALTGCELRVAGRNPSKLSLLERRGIAAGPAEALTDRWADVAVEATGNAAGLAIARRAVRPRGTIVLKSTYHGEATVNLSAIVVDEITVVGSRCGPFAKALRLLASGGLDVSDLVSDVRPLAESEAAFETAGRRGVLKVLVRAI